MEIDKPNGNEASLEWNATLVRGQVDITSEATLWFTAVVFRVYVTPAISIFGFVSNIINVIVFSRMNLNEGTSATFLVLSITDGLISFLSIVSTAFTTLRYMGPARYGRSAYGLHAMIAATSTFPKFSSMFATVVIAVVRCFSVAIPLHAKSILTVRRQLVSILLLVFSSTAVMAYCMTMYKFIFIRDPATNWTHLVLTLTHGFINKVQIVDQFGAITFYVCFSAVNVCLVVLVVALKQSSQFRTRATGNDMFRDLRDDKNRRKERQVVKTVVLVSLVFTVCNLPGIALTIVRQALPGFRAVGYLYRSFDMFFIFADLMIQTSSAVNIFIYIYSNSSYRRIFNASFRSNYKTARQ